LSILINRIKGELADRADQGLLRSLTTSDGLVDFCSNDYLGINRLNFKIPLKQNHGSNGSRLIAGNNRFTEDFEAYLSQYFGSEDALIFNSGYSANVGFFSAIAKKGDEIFFDSLIHASVRDGYRLSFAKHIKFAHNNLEELEAKLSASKSEVKIIVIESLYSMDGDIAPIEKILTLCAANGAYLVIDEAHASGVNSPDGKGYSYPFRNHPNLIARLITFGKAYGGHGAAFLLSKELKNYLINFSRSLIYSTASPPSQIEHNWNVLLNETLLERQRVKLQKVIDRYKETANQLKINGLLNSNTQIQGIIVKGNFAVKSLGEHVNKNGMDARPIVSPTVAVGKERVRICLHSFNTLNEVDHLLKTIKEWQESNFI
jgi:8-amino-7-oxononanoate synthase